MSEQHHRMPSEAVDQLLDTQHGSYYYLREYVGPGPQKTLRRPIVGPPDRPFAEMQIVQRLEQEGWLAAWAYRAGKSLRSWEPREEVALPGAAAELLDRIQVRGGPQARMWDIVAWKDEQLQFVDVQRMGSSQRLSAGKTRWQRTALEVGVPKNAFRRVEWLGGSLDGYAIVAGSYQQEKLMGWVRYTRARGFEFGEGENDGVGQWVDYYARRTGLRGADLLWVLFRDNQGGAFSYWNLRQERDRKARARSSTTVTEGDR